jgi:hypothetical protein
LAGRKIRKSLDLRNWEAAQKLVRDWEANPSGRAVTVSQACEKFMADAKARNLSEGMIRKLRHVTNELKDALAAVPLRSVTVDDVRNIREGWKLAPVTTQKRLEMLRGIFRFCVDSITRKIKNTGSGSVEMRSLSLKLRLWEIVEKCECRIWP